MRAGALRIAMLGTRGVPARYGGFETAVEEIGRRLVARGHDVVVYRRPTDADPVGDEYHGMRLVTLPALRSKSLETLSHTGVSSLHLLHQGSADVIFLFNAANAPFLPLLRLRRIPTAVHLDGLEWKRAKWNRAGRLHYRLSESLAARWADALIADAPGIADYHRLAFGATTELIAYGAPLIEEPRNDRLGELGLKPDGFHLVVARFEPENHVDLIVRGYRRSRALLPLVVVGSAPYSDDHTRAIIAAASGDPRIRLVGPVWDQELLDQLYAGARHYLHGHEVGGTNPSLLRAMGAGTAVSAYDVRFNRDVLGEGAWTFADEVEVQQRVEEADMEPQRCAAVGAALQQRARTSYRWDDVAEAYEHLARRLASGWSRRREVSGRRRKGERSWELATEVRG